MLELAKLYYDVSRRYFTCPLNTYISAMEEVEAMVTALGHTMSDLAKMAAVDVEWKKIYED